METVHSELAKNPFDDGAGYRTSLIEKRTHDMLVSNLYAGVDGANAAEIGVLQADGSKGPYLQPNNGLITRHGFGIRFDDDAGTAILGTFGIDTATGKPIMVIGGTIYDFDLTPRV